MTLTGRTRLIPIVGDPIAQVKSPEGLTRAFAERGIDTIVVPIHVGAGDLESFVRGVSGARNVDGLIATVPHKFALYRLCATASPAAHFLGAANVARRAANGAWHGDMLDGAGFVAAARDAGGDPAGRRALLVGAGGAGSAIALALLDAGVATLGIHDQDSVRRDALFERLATRGRVHAASDDPSGYSFIAQASTAGMRAADPYPVAIGRLTAAMFVGDVITEPEITPLLARARAAGCATQTGVAMFNAVAASMLDFFARNA